MARFDPLMVQVVVPNPNFAIRADSVNQLERWSKKLLSCSESMMKAAVFPIQAIKAGGLVLQSNKTSYLLSVRINLSISTGQENVFSSHETASLRREEDGGTYHFFRLPGTAHPV